MFWTHLVPISCPVVVRQSEPCSAPSAPVASGIEPTCHQDYLGLNRCSLLLEVEEIQSEMFLCCCLVQMVRASAPPGSTLASIMKLRCATGLRPHHGCWCRYEAAGNPVDPLDSDPGRRGCSSCWSPGRDGEEVYSSSQVAMKIPPPTDHSLNNC